MNRPAVSVVLLNYNHGLFLSEALAALKAALGPDDELLAFDDASTDDSVGIYRAWAAQMPQVRVILKEKNQGVIACENEGIATARHPYIYFAAADDRVDAAFFDRLLSLLAAHPTAGLAGCRTRLIDRGGRSLGMLKTPKILSRSGFLSRDQVAEAFLHQENWLVGSGTIYRRDALMAAGGFREELGSFADGFAARTVAFRHGACFTPEVLSNWRQMAEGFASAETADLERIRDIGQRALSLMQRDYAGVFPPAYPKRWYRRWMFGAVYYGWRCRNAAGWARLGLLDQAPALRQRIAAMSSLIVGVGLFVYWRPRDLGEAVLRHVAYLRHGED